MSKYAAFLLLALLSGCAESPRIETVGGLRILHVPGGECPTHPSAIGCFVRVDCVVFYADSPTRIHEIDHCRGMQHGPWMQLSGRNCALVIAQGATQWQVGTYICRGSGSYYASR